MKRYLILLLLFLITIPSCDAQKPINKIIESGTLKNNLYTNNYLKFSIKIPKSWKVQNSEYMKILGETAEEIVKNENPDFTLKKGREDLSDWLLVCKEHNFELLDNASVMIGLEDLSNTSIKNSLDYLNVIKKIILDTKLPYKLTEINDFYSENGSLLKYFNAYLNYNGAESNQIIYCYVNKKYAIITTCTYQTDNQLIELDNMMNSFKY